MKETGTITSVVLRNCGIDDAALADISVALETTDPSTDLRMLNLNYNQLTHEGMNSVLKIVKAKTDLKIML